MGKPGTNHDPQIPAVLKRLIEEVRREREEGAEPRPAGYDRVYNRHIGDGGYNRVYNRLIRR